MNGLPYYKAYPRDFMEGTINLPFELKGAYRLVLDLIYMQGGKLPDNSRYIAGLLGCSTKAWNGYRAKLIELGKLCEADGFLTNDRADAELEMLAKLSQTQREKRLGKSKNNDLQEPQLNQPEPEPEPKVRESTSYSQAHEARAVLCSVLSESVADDYIAHRKAKRAKLTLKAAQILAKDLAPVGRDAADAAALKSIAQGWTGIFPAPLPSNVIQHPAASKGQANGKRTFGAKIMAIAERYAAEDAAQQGMADGQDWDAAIPVLPRG